jgi:glucose/arabinose dehydrogenase
VFAWEFGIGSHQEAVSFSLFSLYLKHSMPSRLTFIIVGIIAGLALVWFSFGLYTWFVRNQSSYRLELLPDGRITSHQVAGNVTTSTTGTERPTQVEASRVLSISLTGDIVTKDLVVPIGAVPLSGGRMIVVQRNGQIYIVFPDQTTTLVGTIPGVVSGGELGVVSIAPVSVIVSDQPQFYSLFSYRNTTGEIFNKVSKISVVGVVSSSSAPGRVSEDILLDQIPTSSNNNSGAVALGPDEMVWVLSGDAGRAVLVQDPLSKAGKVLRLLPSGKIPTGNPVTGPAVYAQGLRRPMGITWNDKGEGFLIDSGNGGYDEINRLVRSGNYGWPMIGGCWSEDDVNSFIDPIVCSGKNSWSPSGLDWKKFSTASSSDILMMTGLASKSLYEVVLPRASTTGLMVRPLIQEIYGRLRAVTILGGDVWLATSNRDSGGSSKAGDDKIIRITLP